MRIPSLDGLRAVSIALVLVSHGMSGVPITKTHLWNFVGRGDLGVSIFFVISGFLITSLLLREEEKAGKISLRDFYIRRSFRIIPPFYAYLFVVLLASHFGWLSSHAGPWLASLLFFRDYAPVPWEWSTGHSWSLSIEEQFYLLWPFALAMLGRRKGLKVAIVLIASIPVIRTISHGVWNHGPFDFYMFHFRVDGLMVGSLLALLQPKQSFQAFWRRAESGWTAFGCVAFLLLFSPAIALLFRGWYTLPVGMSLENFAIAYIMFYVIRNPDCWTGRVLNWKPIAYIGTISYSLYLWQQPFLSGAHRVLPALVAAFACALLSWYLIEIPSRWMRDRVMARKASNLKLASQAA